MIRNSWWSKLCLVAACSLGVTVAQEKDAGPKAPAKKVASEEEPAKEPVVDHPIIIQLRESAPTTLDQLTRALRITSQLGRADEFKVYAAEWLKLTPTEPDLAAINRKYGADFFFELARRPELQPEGEQIADAVLGAAAKQARDPDRLKDLITKLSDSGTRMAGLRGLRQAGDAGIVALIQALADDTFKPDRAAIRSALVALGRDSIDPLVAALAAPLPETRADAAIVLGRLRAQSALPYLVGLSAAEVDSPDRAAAKQALARLEVEPPTPRQARTYLTERIQSLLDGEAVGKLDANGETPLWRWDAKAETVDLDRYPKEIAALLVASRLATQLMELNPAASEQRLALLVQLETDQALAGLDQPLLNGQGAAWETANALGIEAIEGALLDAIELDRPTAIAALTQVLGASGRSELLDPQNGRESPLVKALGYPDRRVQVSALKAILALEPTQPFKGASRVIDTMKFLLSSSGQPRVLVGHPRPEAATRIATLYGNLGYEADHAATGRSLVRRATENSDYELILISETIDGPSVQETAQVLRKDPRTARIPLGIMEHFVVLNPKFIPGPLAFSKEHKKVIEPLSEEERVELLLTDSQHAPQRLPGNKAETAADAVELAVVVPLPYSPESLNYVHDQVMRLAPSRHVAPEIRLEHAHFVLEQVAALLGREHPPEFFDFSQLEADVIAASRVPSLSTQAATVLGLLASPKAQATLVEQASLPANAVADRDAAVKALALAVQRRGIGLTVAQIERLYARHERSAGPQQAQLGELLEIIEAPTAESRQQRQKLHQK